MKLLLLLLLIFVPKIQAKIYYLDAQTLDENEYQIKETKKYRFYKEEKIYNYFIEDENDQDFLNKDNKKYFYTTYSEYSKEKLFNLKVLSSGNNGPNMYVFVQPRLVVCSTYHSWPTSLYNIKATSPTLSTSTEARKEDSGK